MNSQLLIASALVASAFASDFRVTVGISQITGQVGTGFDPNRIVPLAGDTITFSWLIPSYINNPQTGSYSVTQGSISSPCQPLAGGFSSGPQTTGPESAGTAPTQVFTVKDTQPMYFYSSVGDQCKSGMVLGVNTPASGAGSVEAYITAAGGNPNADTTTNSTTTTSANSTTAAPTSSTNKTSTTTTGASNSTAKASNATSSTNSSGSAKPQNGAGSLFRPQAVAILLVCSLASLMFM